MVGPFGDDVEVSGVFWVSLVAKTQGCRLERKGRNASMGGSGEFEGDKKRRGRMEGWKDGWN